LDLSIYCEEQANLLNKPGAVGAVYLTIGPLAVWLRFWIVHKVKFAGVLLLPA
jgi:hypothetical protein